jgi:hypothetical protein
MTDELRERLARLDPMHSEVPTESVTTPSSRQLLEDIMSTPVIEQPETGPTPKKSRWLLGVAAAAALIVAVGGALALSDGGSADPTVAAGPPLELNAGANDSMAMCIVFDVEFLAPMPVAFEGTVTEVEGDRVTLTADHWFKGGDASQVVINAPQGLEALIDSFPLELGEQYLITATDGNVNYCGFSGPSTPELRSAFEEAFGS